MYRTILFDQNEGIVTVTLNRPEALNAYTPEMGEEIVDAFRRIRDDDASRVVILTGAGRGFCSGVDLEHLKRMHAGGEASREARGGFRRGPGKSTEVRRRSGKRRPVLSSSLHVGGRKRCYRR